MASTQDIHCEHEGIDLVGQLALPSGPGPHPAVLVAPSAHGVSDRMRHVAAQLADEGYLAVAVDMYGGGVHSTDKARVGELVAPLWGNSARVRSRMAAWLDTVRARPDVDDSRMAAIGYCFGGMCVLELARSGADIAAVASFHGILPTDQPAQAGSLRAPIAVFTGARDPHVPPADVAAFRAEMVAAGASWQITEYGDAYHSFTDPAADHVERGIAYDPLAEKTSWAATLALLDARLRG